MTWRPTDRDGLLAATGDSAMARLVTDDRCLAAVSEDGWAYVAPWRPSGHWGGGAFPRTGAGARGGADPSAALALLSGLAEERGVAIEWFSTRAGEDLTSPAGEVLPGGGCWSFLWTGSAPDRAEVRARWGGVGLEVEELDDARDAAEIEAFARPHNPDFEGFPGRGFATVWLGSRDRAGDLVGVGALHRLANGVPHLSGLVVHSGWRGRGLGAALTTELTARAVADHGVSTLGVYTANATALRLYARLGYRRDLDLHTRSLPAAPPA